MRYVVQRKKDGKFYRGREFGRFDGQRWCDGVNRAFIFTGTRAAKQFVFHARDQYTILEVRITLI